jgi:hypothetical protein
MKMDPIHQNLNTSFVNVAALVRYLGSLHFVGRIRIELASYEADIVFTGSKTIEAREYDHIAGRISHGKHAFQRILIRAREPHGRVHVYRSAGSPTSNGQISTYVDRSIAANARKMAGAPGGSAATDSRCDVLSNGRNSENAAMLSTISDLLRVIDQILSEANLSFSAAFRLSCKSIAKDYAFLRRRRNALVYREGSVFLSTPADPATIASAVFAALRPIFRRLRSEQKYDRLFRRLAEDLRESSDKNRSSYEHLGLTKFIDELLAA